MSESLALRRSNVTPISRVDDAREDRALPHDEMLERLVLQFMGEHGDTVGAFIEAGLCLDHFRRRDYREHAAIVFAQHAGGLVPQWPLIRAQLASSGVQLDDPIEFDGFTVGTPRPIVANIRPLVERLEAFRRRRVVILAGAHLSAACFDADVDLPRALAAFNQTTAAEITGLAEESVCESLPTLVARLGDRCQRDFAIDDLMALGEIALIFGPPRSMKTQISLAIAAALTVGAPMLFGLERLRIDRPRRVWYLTNEDRLSVTVPRACEMVRGLGVDELPENFLIRCGGVNLDDPSVQQKIIDGIRRDQPEVVILEPLRTLSAAVDKGPAEFKPIGDYFRQRVVGETGVALLIGHHDTKPQPGQVETRRRAQRASGGGLFSISDSPLHAEPIDERAVLLSPDAFKHQVTPPAMLLRLETGDGWRRLVGEIAEARTATSASLHGRILEHLRSNPGNSGSAVASGLRARKDDVIAALKELCAADRIDCLKQGRADRWFAKGDQKGTVPDGSC